MKKPMRTVLAALLAAAATTAAVPAHAQSTQATQPQPAPLFVIDGTVVGRHSLGGQALTDSVLIIGDRTLRGEEIERIVMTKAAAAHAYGVDGRDGVIHITTRSSIGVAPPPKDAIMIVDGVTLRSADALLHKSTPLLVVDGVVLGGGMTMESLNLAPDAIASIEVVKGAAAAQLYGARAADGVVQIRLKK